MPKKLDKEFWDNVTAQQKPQLSKKDTISAAHAKRKPLKERLLAFEQTVLHIHYRDIYLACECHRSYDHPSMTNQINHLR